ncbi:MAG: hypothetical protein QXI16_04160 [Sulfolobaceae archaeon]
MKLIKEVVKVNDKAIKTGNEIIEILNNSDLNYLEALAIIETIKDMIFKKVGEINDEIN